MAQPVTSDAHSIKITCICSWGSPAHFDFKIASQLRRHHAKRLVNPKVRAKKKLLILDTPEHVDSENIKLKMVSGACSTNFFQNVI
jgi:hypothetical protein